MLEAVLLDKLTPLPDVALAPDGEHVCDTQPGDETPCFLKSARLRRFTELWIEERRRQIAKGAST